MGVSWGPLGSFGFPGPPGFYERWYPFPKAAKKMKGTSKGLEGHPRRVRETQGRRIRRIRRLEGSQGNPEGTQGRRIRRIRRTPKGNPGQLGKAITDYVGLL